jgi:hypothetical protein
MTKQWFDVDRMGLGKQAEQHGKGRLVGELIQNALDEEGVTRIDVTLTLVPGRPLADLTVEDDSPEGFRDLSHAYTLFAESYKRTNPEQRGQYNFGEKLVLAVCERASISTTKGTVLFDAEGRTEKPRTKRERGSVFEGRIRMTRDEYADALAYLQTLLVPTTVEVTLNGDLVFPRDPLHSFEASLETPIADENGVMRQRVRKTTISIFEALPDETPTLYEMGLPIVETGDKWHLSVAQKVPLNRDRDDVRPSYLRTIRMLVLNEMHDRLTEEDANQTWVRQASSDPDCSASAINRVLDLRFGEKRASYDPSDHEANNNWVSQGGTLVYGSMLNKDEWQNAREAEAIVPAGKLCPTPKPYSDDPNADPADIIPEAQWSAGMRQIADYARFLGKELMGVKINVTMVNTPNNFLACYGKGGRLHFNVRHLGGNWFDQGANEAVDELLVHEFGHEYSCDHLSHEYHEALCRLAAKLKRLAMEKIEEMRGFGM